MNGADMQAICRVLEDVRDYGREHSFTENDKWRLGQFIGAARVEAIRRGDGDRLEYLNKYISLAE